MKARSPVSVKRWTGRRGFYCWPVLWRSCWRRRRSRWPVGVLVNGIRSTCHSEKSGCPVSEIGTLYGRSLFWIGLCGTLVGCALGWVLQETFIRVLGNLLPVEPGAAGLKPVLIGGVTAAVCLMFFAWPPLRRLGQASPLRVLRADMGVAEAQRSRDFVLGSVAIVALMWWYSGSALVTSAVIAGYAS
ncbi:MAG: hypothetical protein CM15mP125_1820 [Gammaproteobacteria bacterium]|nr:MAG: hypothetical protein CM15mP125_1820 [Gammaproteobacteria bacterium]